MKECKFGLEFPEGTFLSDGSIFYLWMDDEAVAYKTRPNKSELLGKHCHLIKTGHSDIKAQDYSVTYEFEDGDLIAARLITSFSRSAGIALSPEKIKDINEKLANDSLEICEKQQESRICHAGQLMDGRFLVLLDDYSTGKLERTLYAGPKGQLEIVETNEGMQGGNSFYYKDAKTGERIEFEAKGFASGRDLHLAYGDVLGVGIDVEDHNDLEAWGISMPSPKPHCDIFTHPKSKFSI